MPDAKKLRLPTFTALCSKTRAKDSSVCADNALAVALCGFATSPTNPLRGLCVEAPSLWRRAALQLRPRTLCGDCACRIALVAVAPCEFATSPRNPLWRLCVCVCVSNRSRCGAVRICNFANEPSVEIASVESLSLWRRAEIVRVESLSLWRRAEIARDGSLELWRRANFLLSLLANGHFKVVSWFARLLSQSRRRFPAGPAQEYQFSSSKV